MDFYSLEKTDYLGILSGVGAALAYTSIRELRRFYDSRAIVLSFMAVGTIFPLIFMIISEFYTNPLIIIKIKEQIGIKGWIGVIVGFIGILFIAEFDGSSLEKTDYLGITSHILLKIFRII